jgi:hypothetical protein
MPRYNVRLSTIQYSWAVITADTEEEAIGKAFKERENSRYWSEASMPEHEVKLFGDTDD